MNNTYDKLFQVNIYAMIGQSTGDSIQKLYETSPNKRTHHNEKEANWN